MKRLICILLVTLLHVSERAHAQTNAAPTNRSDRIRQELERIRARSATNAPAAATNKPAGIPPAIPALPAPTVPAVPATTQAAPAAPKSNAPAVPPAPGAPTPAVSAGAATPKAGAGSKERKPTDVFQAGYINFQNMELLQALDFYAELIGKTVLRPGTLPNTQITLKTQTEMTREELVQALDSVFALNNVAIIPQGEKFIKVVPTPNAFTEGAAFSKKDATDLPEADQFITVIKQLEHIKPSELVPAIQPFAKNPTGIVPIDASGVVVLRDFAINVKRMLEVIEQVDKVQPLEVELEVIPIKYAIAADIASVLGSLTSGGATSVPGSTSASRNRTTPGSTYRPGGTTSPLGGSSTGTLGGANPLGATPGGVPGSTSGSRSSFQNALQNIVRTAANQGGNAPLLGDAKIIPDDRTNSLLIFGTTQEREMVKNIVAKLDVVQAQVLIEGIIMEVSLKDTRDLGVSYAQTAKRYGNNFQGFGGVNNGNFLSGTNTGPVLPSELPSGFSYFGNLGNNWQAALNAIATDSSVNVLSRPRIQTSHAMEAQLFVGDTVPYITGTYFGGVNGQASSQYQEKQVGITLSVLPLINQDGLVVMDINQDIEQLGTPTTIDGNSVPTTTKRQASARVAVKDGDTIILGGFISSNKQNTKSGVPYLKDIPLLGALFRSSTKSNQRTELIVLIRPTVLPNPEAAAMTATAERNKLSGIKRAEMEITDEENALHKEAEDVIKKAEEKKAKDTAEHPQK